MRDQVTMASNDCKMRNCITTKNKRLHDDRAEFKKYGPKWRKHNAHKETKEGGSKRPKACSSAWLEHRAPKPGVGGSNPSRPAIVRFPRERDRTADRGT